MLRRARIELYRNRNTESSVSNNTGLYIAQNCIKQPRYLLHQIL